MMWRYHGKRKIVDASGKIAVVVEGAAPADGYEDTEAGPF